MGTPSAKTLAKRTKDQPAKAMGDEAPRCLAIAQKGLNNSQQFTAFFSALIPDIIEGRVVPKVANASCNAGGKILQMIALEIKHGREDATTQRKMLTIAVPAVSIQEVSPAQ